MVEPTTSKAGLRGERCPRQAVNKGTKLFMLLVDLRQKRELEITNRQFVLKKTSSGSRLLIAINMHENQLCKFVNTINIKSYLRGYIFASSIYSLLYLLNSRGPPFAKKDSLYFNKQPCV